MASRRRWNESCTAFAAGRVDGTPIDATFAPEACNRDARCRRCPRPPSPSRSKNYSSWSLRGWLLCKLAGLEFEEELLPLDDPSARAELLLLSPSFLVPCLTHDGVKVWDTLAIAEYLAEVKPEAGLLPADRAARAHCRAICGEMHSGFANLRSALPMNLKAHHPGFKVWAGAQADIDRIMAIWRECLATYGGPYPVRQGRPWRMPCTPRCARAS